jgi:hypothetical protein
VNDALAASLSDAGDANLDNYAQSLTLAGSGTARTPSVWIPTAALVVKAVIATAVAA